MTIATERTHAQRIQPNRHNKPNLTERKMQTCRCPDPSGCADPLTSPCLDTGSWDGQGSRGTLARTASPHGTPRYRIHPARPQNVHLCNRNPGHCLPLHRAGCGSGQKTVSFRKRLKTATWQPWHNGMTPIDSRRKNATTRTVGGRTCQQQLCDFETRSDENRCYISDSTRPTSAADAVRNKQRV